MEHVSITPEPARQPLLEISGLVKSFGSTRALQGVDLTVAAGSIHGLIGANGAGKSTLIKILSGLHRATAGTVKARGRDGGKGRVGFVHQDLGLVDGLTVRENLQLGARTARRAGILIDHPRERRLARERLALVDLAIDPDTMVGDLKLGHKTLVAIARLFAENHDIVVLDEVTAALTRRESAWLMHEVRRFTDRGGSAIVVSHRLYEISEFCDEVTLLRDGRVTYAGPTPSLAEIHRLFIGDDRFERRAGPPLAAARKRPVLELRRAAAEGVGPIDLSVHGGEVVGLVGSLSSNLYALGHLTAGTLATRSGVRTLHVPGDAAGRVPVGFLPEDRRGAGIFPELEVSTNISIRALRSLGSYGLIRRRREAAAVSGAMRELGVVPDDPSKSASDLSGGNQQKVLLGRALLAAPALFVLCEPTHGVDLNTRTAIYRFVERVRDEGAAVLIVTIDADDAMAVSDRIGLVEAGRITELTDRNSLTIEQILERVS